MPALDNQIPLSISVLTVSDTRTLDNDTSGDTLIERLKDAGHTLFDRKICKDDRYALRAQVSVWIHNQDVNVILLTGGTGFSNRDITEEAITPLLDVDIPGFGEIFRSVSYQEIGTSTIQSRAFAGIANKTLIFCMPGSTGACKTAWDSILSEQLDSTHKPCNFVGMLKK